MASGLIKIVKQAALDAMANEQMCDLRYGTVVSTEPLRVQISSQLTIPSTLLVVPQSLTTHRVNVTIGDVPQIMTIRNELKLGDKVVLLRKQGGQSYFILDRI